MLVGEEVGDYGAVLRAEAGGLELEAPVVGQVLEDLDADVHPAVASTRVGVTATMVQRGSCSTAAVA